MKNSILLLLFCGSFFFTQGQNTTSGIFQNPLYIQAEPSFFGTTDITYFECESDIILDGSSSMGEDSYNIRLAEFDLTTWTDVNVFYSQWICTSCTVPNNIDVLSYFPNGKPECDKTYLLTLATGPVYDAEFFFFSVDCGDDPLLKTFNAKLNSNDFDSIALPNTNDLSHSAYEDPVTKDVRVAGYTNGLGSGSFDPFMANFDNAGTKQLFDRSVADAQNDFIYYNNPAIIDCASQGAASYAMLMTGRRDDDFLISIDDPLTGQNIYHNTFGENSGATEVGHSIIQDPNENIVAVGFANNGTTDDVYVVVLDSCLDIRFTKQYTLSENARANSVAIVDGLLNISGSPLGGFQYAITGTIGNDGFVMIIDPFTGDPIGPGFIRYDINNNFQDTGESIIMDQNGEIVITGTTSGIESGNPQPTFPTRRPYILKIGKGDQFDSAWGSINAITRIDIQNSPDESSHSIAETKGGDYVITGFSQADYAIVNQGIRPASTHITKVSGDLSSIIFSNSYSEGARSTIGERISVTANDRLIVAGYCTEQYELNSGALTFDSDIYLIATDSLGQLDNCICYEEETAVLLSAMPTATPQAVLQADLTQIEFPINLQYAAHDLPVSYCDKYCPEPTGGSTCAASGCPTNAVLNISTGIDGGGNLLTTNNPAFVDPYWKLMNFPPLDGSLSPTNLPDMFGINLFQPLWNDISGSPISQPISVVPQAAFGDDNIDPTQPWRIRREFCVCDTTQVLIQGNLRVDDEGALRLYGANPVVPLVNLLGGTPPAPNVNNFNQDWPINWTGTLAPGTYHLEFEMVNESSTAMGFNVSALITDLGNNAYLSNPSANCCTNGVISIQKIIDNDCDGGRSTGDGLGAGWTFQVTNNSTGITTTHTTNNVGEITLRQLPFGTYTITETFASPWMPSDGTGGTQTITIDANNPVGMATFLNKNPELCTCIEEIIQPIYVNTPTQDSCCCFEVLVDNDYGPYYDEIEFISNGFTMNMITNTSTQPFVSNNSSFKASYVIPLGTQQSVATFCTADLNGASTMTANWYKSGSIICSNDVDLQCAIGDTLIKTFDVTHSIQEDTLQDQFDFGVAGFQNSDGDFVSFGYSINTSSNEWELAFAKYDHIGRILGTPQLNNIIDPNIGFYEIVDAKEILNSIGLSDGYLVLLYADLGNNSNQTMLARLDVNGVMTWLETLNSNQNNPLNLIPRDMIIDNDKAWITGKYFDNSIEKPFVISYDIISRSISCSNSFDISSTVLLSGEGSVIEKMSNGNFAIAGRHGNEIVYFEIDNNCNRISTKAPKFINVTGDPGAIDIPIKILESNAGSPVVCGNVEFPNGDKEIFIHFGAVVAHYKLNNDEAELNDATLNDDGDIVLTGLVDLSQQKHGFLAVSNFKFGFNPSFDLLWAKRYFDLEYPETAIQQMDLVHDGGYYTVGYGIDEDDPSSFFDFEYYDTWIMKTNQEGGLEDCDCFAEIPWDKSDWVSNDTIDIFDNGLVVNNNTITFSNNSLQEAEYVCDRYCPDTCMISSVLNPLMIADTCCYTLDLYNNNSFARKIEIISNTPGVFFDIATISTSFNLYSNSPQSIIIDNNGQLLPLGTSLNYLQFCLGNTGSTVTLQNFTIKYLDASCNEFPECEQIVEGECLLECTDEECVDIFNISVECDSLVAGKFKFTYQVMNKTTDAVLTDLNWNVLTPGTILGATSTPIVAPIGPGITSVDQCIDIFDAGPTFPKQVDIVFAASGYIVGHPDSLMCCHDQKDTVTITLPNCCDPCDTTWVVEESIQVIGGECCYNLDINNSCDDLLSKIKVSSITSGVNLGSHWNPNYPSTWNFTPSSATEVIWQPSTTPFAPAGNYVDLIYFCLDNTVGATNPQVKVEYITTNSNGVDSVLCEEILDLVCEVDIECIDITQDTVYCDDAGNYFLDFCVQNISVPAFNADELLVSKLSSTPPFLNLNQYTWNVVTNPSDFPLVSGAPPVCFSVPINGFGTNLPMAGDMMDLAFNLKNIAGDSCCYESDTISITLPPCPVDTCCTDLNDFEMRAQQTMISKISCSPTVGEVANSLLNNCNEVNIDWGDGQFDVAVPSSSLPIQHTYASAGIYVVEVLINEFDTNGNLCFEFLVSDTIDCTVSTNDLIWENQISFFPNPFTQDFQIKIENSNHDGFDLEVLSMDGKMILKDQISARETSKILEMKNQDAGIYLIRITDSDGNRAIHRMVKMNF